jgi:hypothetical protein
MSSKLFLLLNLALGFYNVGTIWAHEVDIFRSWKLADSAVFPKIQDAHWRKIPYWVFVPVGLALIGNIVLLWFHPMASPIWWIRGAVASQTLSLVLTGLFWGPWQARLAKDPLGSESPFLARILGTHWIRTVLINANALCLLCVMAAIL